MRNWLEIGAQEIVMTIITVANGVSLRKLYFAIIMRLIRRLLNRSYSSTKDKLTAVFCAAQVMIECNNVVQSTDRQFARNVNKKSFSVIKLAYKFAEGGNTIGK